MSAQRWVLGDESTNLAYLQYASYPPSINVKHWKIITSSICNNLKLHSFAYYVFIFTLRHSTHLFYHTCSMRKELMWVRGFYRCEFCYAGYLTIVSTKVQAKDLFGLINSLFLLSIFCSCISSLFGKFIVPSSSAVYFFSRCMVLYCSHVSMGPCGVILITCVCQ